MFFYLDPQTKKCVSSGNQDDVAMSENSKLLILLEQISLNKTGIRMPAGKASSG